jgi:hypothetical protein
MTFNNVGCSGFDNGWQIGPIQEGAGVDGEGAVQVGEKGVCGEDVVPRRCKICDMGNVYPRKMWEFLGMSCKKVSQGREGVRAK